MKDYNLIMYLAKLTGAKPKKDKDSLYCFFPYSDDVAFTTFFMFEKGKSTAVYFDLEDVYEEYASRDYASYPDFVDALVSRWDFFEAREVEGDYYVYSDLTVNKIENTASAALTNITVMCNCLNEMLGRNEDSYSEEEWRNLHRSLLDKKRKQSLIGVGGSIAAAVLGIVLLILDSNDGGGLALLGLLLIPVGIIAAIVFGIKMKYYKSQIQKSLNAR